MYIRILIIVGLSILAFNQSVYAANKKQCSADKIKEILVQASEFASSVDIDCSFRLNNNDQITKQLVLKGESAANIQLDCNHAVLKSKYLYPSVLIRADYKHDKWSVPHHIEIKNCVIHNGLRVQGMARNGQDPLLKKSSYQQGHIQRVQDAAPYSILLDNLKLIAGERNMMYFAPGVHDITLQNSQFLGTTPNLALYLDAESKNNVIRNNIFNVQTKKRELIAIDGSENNQILNNHFINPLNGVIFLYRNCGEGAVIRHQTPSHNRILNNSFEIQKNLVNPQIWIGSRNGNRKYCALDKGYTLGSSQSDLDYAHYNIVKNNYFIILSKFSNITNKTLPKSEQLIKVSSDHNTIESNFVK